jgi:hypothetical protein
MALKEKNVTNSAHGQLNKDQLSGLRHVAWWGQRNETFQMVNKLGLVEEIYGKFM